MIRRCIVLVWVLGISCGAGTWSYGSDTNATAKVFCPKCPIGTARRYECHPLTRCLSFKCEHMVGGIVTVQ
jgi:hypothetical protein